MADKWQLNRAGILNFWYYDEHIFDFSDGKLLLRGSNGSGKSVTMQSFLPVLLDGKKTPSRLDPFGSQSRRMEDYLLGEKEVSNIDERTGYLWIEYKKENTEQYITTGMGMQAKRNQQLKSWGFALTDNRRIGEDIELYKWLMSDGEKKKFPRSKTELETVIGDGGEVVNSNKEYMMLVNKHVFGFETLEAYEDLIKLLIQLRSPKLSKDFKPTVIYEILEEALPPLTDDDLRNLSDSIEQMEQTKQQMEQLDREVMALRKINDAYKQYNEHVLYEQIATYKQTDNHFLKETAQLKKLRSESVRLESEIRTLTTSKAHLTNQKETLNEALDRLKQHEIFKLVKEHKEKVSVKEKLEASVQEVDKKIDIKAEREHKLQQQLVNITIEQHEKNKELMALEKELSYMADEIAFANHEQNVHEWQERKGEVVDFDFWKREIHLHNEKLEKAFNLLTEHTWQMEQFMIADRELADSEKERDHIQFESKKWQEILAEEKQKLISQIHGWVEKYPYYEVDRGTMHEISRLVDDLFEKYDYDRIKGKIEPIVNAYEFGLQVEVSKLQGQYLQTEEKLQLLNEEYQERKSQTDPEPMRHKATQDFRKKLDESNIDYAPLYEVVEFKPHVSDDIQRSLESAMLEIGVLDALVTKTDMEIKHDRILQAKPVYFTQTLADYLKADTNNSNIPASRIEEILQSIEMNEEALVHIKPDGAYQLGMLSGDALPYEEVRFVGRAARKRYRLQLLRELENKMLACREELFEYEKQEKAWQEKINDSKKAMLAFPMSNDVKTSYNEWQKNVQKEQLQTEIILQLSERVKELDAKLQQLKRKLITYTAEVKLKEDAKTFENALMLGRTYSTELETLHRHTLTYDQLLKDERREKEMLLDLQAEVDELKGELNIKQDELERMIQSIDHLEQEMKLKGMDEVEREIKKNDEKLVQTQHQLDNVLDQLPRSETMLSQTVNQLQKQEATTHFWHQMLESWKRTITKEWQLTGNTEDVFTSDIFKRKFDSKKTRSALEQTLNSLYYSLQNDLIDHKMTNYTENVKPEPWMEEFKADWQPIIQQWCHQSTRLAVEFDQRGVKLAPHALYQEILHEWERGEHLLDEMDKRLYEEILLHSVGNTLRGRIHRAEIWTKKMKKIMEEGNISSGLTFSIKWRPITAQTENELDTHDLVKLLNQDPSVLNDADIDRVTEHFRSKIRTAQQELLDSGQSYTLLQALKQALDYRKWFTFTLYYERKNEPRRELTNHQFFKFSGGEKALAMYIPLFTACYSRYQESAKHAPYIITLDEAFAGVDANNIEVMFKIVEELGFNYMMNSQILWGDYNAVSSLAVSELLRTQNADFVTIIDYKWDGKILEMVGT